MRRGGTPLTNDVYFARVTVDVNLSKNKAHRDVKISKTVDMPTCSTNVQQMQDNVVDLGYIRRMIGSERFSIRELQIIKKL